ncbi:mucin-7 [Bicyclus anynana]|uniref:Mucin-7 n=1 Tax=Bicyclus anynana TaxID=110368 RepID=A0ABM3M1A8_BICAN|nr:mucin-7 [Bicyclus anynana]
MYYAHAIYAYLEPNGSVARLVSPIYDHGLVENGCFYLDYSHKAYDIKLRVYQVPVSIGVNGLLASTEEIKRKYIIHEAEHAHVYRDLHLYPVSMFHPGYPEKFQIVIEASGGTSVYIEKYKIFRGMTCIKAGNTSYSPPPGTTLIYYVNRNKDLQTVTTTEMTSTTTEDLPPTTSSPPTTQSATTAATVPVTTVSPTTEASQLSSAEPPTTPSPPTTTTQSATTAGTVPVTTVSPTTEASQLSSAEPPTTPSPPTTTTQSATTAATVPVTTVSPTAVPPPSSAPPPITMVFPAMGQLCGLNGTQPKVVEWTYRVYYK